MSNGKKRILLIEDDAYTRDIYQEILEEAGFEVTLAIDGLEGLIKLKSGEHNLVLLDVMMPKMDGISVLKALKSDSSYQPSGKIVLLTNLGHESVIEEANSLGISGFMVKSDLNPDQLVAKVKQFIS